MKNKIKPSSISWLCFMCLILSGCAQARQDNSVYIPPFIEKKEFDANNHVQVLDEYQSDFSIAYLNADDTKTLYLFSSPIAYQDNDKCFYLDNEIKTIDSDSLLKNGYNYTNSMNNISALFPKNLNDNPIQILSKDLTIKYKPCNAAKPAKYNKKDNFIAYQYVNHSLNVTPTTLGVNNKIVGKNLASSYSFNFEIPDEFYIDDFNPDYILIKKGQGIEAIMYKPMLYFENEAGETVYSYQSKIKYNYKNEKHQITYEPDSQFIEQNKNLIITMCFNINHYRKKQPDSTFYSNYPKTNKYLSEFTFVGQDATYGTCETYVRFENLNLARIPLAEINSVEYGVRCMYLKKNSHISLKRVPENWCSLTGNWNDKAAHAEIIDDIVTINNKVNYFNITNLYKLWRNNIGDEKSEFNPLNGFVLCSGDQEGLSIFMSNDNAQNAPFLKINYN